MWYTGSLTSSKGSKSSNSSTVDVVAEPNDEEHESNELHAASVYAIWMVRLPCRTSRVCELVAFNCSARLIARWMAAPRPWMYSSLQLGSAWGKYKLRTEGTMEVLALFPGLLVLFTARETVRRDCCTDQTLASFAPWISTPKLWKLWSKIWDGKPGYEANQL